MQSMIHAVSILIAHLSTWVLFERTSTVDFLNKELHRKSMCRNHVVATAKDPWSRGHRIVVTNLYNLVLTKRQWCCMTGNVTVKLRCPLQCIMDNSGMCMYGLMAIVSSQCCTGVSTPLLSLVLLT